MRRLAASLALSTALAAWSPAFAQSYAVSPLGNGAAATGSNLCSNSSIPAGNTVTNTTVETAFATPCTIPAGVVSVGSMINCQIYGILAVAATVPSLEGRVKINGTTVLDTTAIPGLVAGSGFQWRAEFQFLVLATGTSGSIDAQGDLQAQIATTNELPIPVRNTATFTIDTTVPLVITETAQWGSASTSSAISLRQVSCK